MVQQHSHHPRTSHPAPATLGELRASGHAYRGVKEEIRDNLLAMMRAGQDPFPGIVGFGQTVLPHLERALIAGHDIILLGERGQGKTRLIRTLGRAIGRVDADRRGLRDQRPSLPACLRTVPSGSPRRWATTCRSAGGIATTGTARSSPPRTPASAT
jgi:hypothetical protein